MAVAISQAPVITLKRQLASQEVVTGIMEATPLAPQEEEGEVEEVITLTPVVVEVEAVMTLTPVAVVVEEATKTPHGIMGAAAVVTPRGATTATAGMMAAAMDPHPEEVVVVEAAAVVVVEESPPMAHMVIEV